MLKRRPVAGTSLGSGTASGDLRYELTIRPPQAVQRKVQPFRIVDIERECPDVSRETIRLVLRAMKREGLIEPKGRGRGARWRKMA